MPDSRSTSVEPADLALYDQPASLRNGTAVRVRTARPDDKRRLTELFRRMKKESIYSRFFYDKSELTPEDLQWATEVNFETHVALVVTIGEGEVEAIIGVGRFSVIEDVAPPRRAEVAFAVEEYYHNQGMARMLLRHLSDIAVRLKIASFEADVLVDNRGMLKVFQKSELPMKASLKDKVVHVTLALDQAASNQCQW